MLRKLRTNAKAIELIKTFEGLRLRAYRCPAGKWTIGYGHTRTAKPKQVITEYEAEVLFEEDLKDVESKLYRAVLVDLTDNQFSALSSFVFNIGIVAFRGSTLLELLNKKQFELAAEQFSRWVWVTDKNTQKKVRFLGLVKRREAEKELFLS